MMDFVFCRDREVDATNKLRNFVHIERHIM